LPKHILTVHLGTSACRVSLFAAGEERLGDVEADVSVDYPTVHPQVGWAEQDAQEWWNAVRTGIGSLTAAQRSGVVAVGLAGSDGAVVPVDQAGLPLCRGIVWADHRSVPQLDDLVRTFGRDQVHRVTGLVPGPEVMAGKVLWLREHMPEVFRETRLILQPRDYLYCRLTGSPATDYTLASRTMLFDITRCSWWDDGCRFVGVAPDMLPPVHPSTEAPHRVAGQAARLLGIPDGIPVALGGWDRSCEVLGAAASGSRVMVSTEMEMATNVSVAVRGIPAALDPGVACSLHASDGEAVLDQDIGASGSSLRWLAGCLEGDRIDDRHLGEMAEGVAPGSDDLLFLPFLTGARATRWNPLARGVWFGLTEAHGVGALARSVMEGVAFEVRACLRVLDRMGIVVTDAVAVGEGARSALWNQIYADVLDLPVAVPRHMETISLGAMLIAAVSAACVGDAETAARRAGDGSRWFRPSAPAVERYRGLRDEYERLYDTLRPVFDDVAHGSQML
jgi:xylulokinase